jgi:hypothetical protein
MGNGGGSSLSSFSQSQPQQRITKKIYKLTNVQSRTRDPSISLVMLRSKEIKKAINVKAGITGTDVSEFFEENDPNEDDLGDDKVEQVDAGAADQATIPNTVTASVSGHRSSNISAVSGTNQSTSAAASVNNIKNRGNMIISAIQHAKDQAKTSFEQYIMSKQMVEEFEWRQQRMERDFLEQQHREEWEEDRRRHEEELHEMRLKEGRQ